MDGWTLTDGLWTGPDGEQIRAIAGAQDFGFDLPESSFTPPTDFGNAGDFANVGMSSPPDWMNMGVRDPVSPGSGSSSWWSNFFGPGKDGQGVSPLSAFAQTLGLGASGLGIANTIGAMNRQAGQEKAQTQGQGLAAAAAQPAIAYGTQQVQAAQKGELPPPMEAAVKQWTDKAKAEIRSKLAHLGLGDSTAISQYEQQIDEMALSMKANLLQSEGSGGVAALGMGANAGLGLAQSTGQNQALLNSLIEQANRTLGLISSRQ